MKGGTTNLLEQRLEQLKEACQSFGPRMTRQRMEIFHEVAETEEHPDAETLFKRARERMQRSRAIRAAAHCHRWKNRGRSTALIRCATAHAPMQTATSFTPFIFTQYGCITDIYLKEEPPLPEGVDNLGNTESLHLQIRGVCHNCKT